MALANIDGAFCVAWPLDRWQDLSVLVGVSGGADSVALLRLVVAARPVKSSSTARTFVVHVNHGLRGEAADEDQQFVESLCDSLGIECVVGQLDLRVIADAAGDGLEAACRAARYDFFRETAGRLGARYIAVAHTADDQAETILHHVLRGTGLAGLAGMPKFRAISEAATLVRPLLDVRRADIEAYLISLGQSWREDATNRESLFTRNRLRNELLPLLARDYNADVVPALIRLGQQAGESHELVEQMAEQVASSCTLRPPLGGGNRDMLELDCTKLVAVPRHVVRQMFVGIWQQLDWPRQAMGFAEWDALAAIALAEQGTAIKKVFPGEAFASRDGDTLQLKRRRE